MCQTYKFETESHPRGDAAGIHVVAPPPFVLGIVGFYELVIKQCKEVRKPEASYHVSAFSCLLFE